MADEIDPVSKMAEAQPDAAKGLSGETYRALFESIDEAACFIERLPPLPAGTRDYCYLAMNPAMRRMFGIGDVSGQTIRESFPGEAETWYDQYDRVLETGESVRFERESKPKGLVLSMFVARVEDGTRQRLMVVMQDVTERRRADAAPRASEERQRFLLKFSDALRAEATVEAVADRAIRMLAEQLRLDRCYITALHPEENRADLIHQVGNDRVPPLLDEIVLSSFPAALRVTSDRTLVIEDEFEGKGLSEDEKRSGWAPGMRAMIAATLRKGEDRPLWAMVAITADPRRWTSGDVTLVEEAAERTWSAVERVTAEAALRTSAERLRLALAAARMGTWSWDVAADVHHRDGNLNALLGLPAEETSLPFGEFLRHVHPEDREVVQGAFDESVKFGRPLSTEFRVVWPDGRVRWLRDQGDVFGTAGRARMAGACVDVTDLKEAESALRTSEERLRAIAANLPNAAVFVVGHDLRYLLAEGEALRHAGFSSVDLEGKTVREAVGSALADEYEPRFRLALSGQEFRVEHFAHGRHYVSHGVPQRDASGRVTAALAVSYEITDRVLAEEAVRTSEQRLRLVLGSATDYAILALSPDRKVMIWSPGAEETFGWTADEMIGRLGDEIFTAEDRTAGEPAREAETARANGRAADERWHVRKDGSRFYGSGVLTPLGPEGALGFVKVLRDLTERKRIDDELRRAHDELEARVADRTEALTSTLASLEEEMVRRRELSRRLATSQEDERRRVSRELHDSVGQLLAALSLVLTAVDTPGELPLHEADKLAKAKELVEALGKEVHSLAIRLRPTSLDDIGLESALGQLIAEWSSRHSIRADFFASGLQLGRLDPEIETALYRVIQEALTNVARHARATVVSVVVSRLDNHVTAVVEDNGAGFDVESVPKGRLGLVGMMERVALVGGKLELESEPGSGTTVFVRVPLGTGEVVNE